MKEDYSKREINKKIEKIFTGEPANKKTLSKPSYKKLPLKNLPRIIVALLFLGLMGFSWWYYFSGKATKPLELISLNESYFWELTQPIIATPILSDINNDGTSDLIAGDLAGNIYALDVLQQKEIFNFKLPQGILAPLSKVQVSAGDSEQILATDQQGNFYVLNKQGNYLYESRKEFFNEPIWSKGSFLPPLKKGSGGLIILTSEKGTLWGVDARYGEVIWENKSSPLQGQSLFPAPVVVREKNHLGVIAVSQDGGVGFFDVTNGFLQWHYALKENIKSSPIIVRYKNETLIFIITLNGRYAFLNLTGEEIISGEIDDSFVSTPSQIHSKKNSPKIVLGSNRGNLYYLNYQDLDNVKVEKIQNFSTATSDAIISSPVIVDLNFDKEEDIVVVTRNGRVGLLNGATGELFLPLFQVGSKVTATPLIADINNDRNLEIIIAGEEGKISFLSLLTSPAQQFPANAVLCGEFLKNSLNQNNFKK